MQAAKNTCLQITDFTFFSFELYIEILFLLGTIKLIEKIL